MYSTDFICTYNYLKDDEDKDLAPMLYRIQLLNAFNMEEFDEKKLVQAQEELYKKVEQNENFIKIFKIIREKYTHITNDNLSAFILLFSYDYFADFHRYLIDFFNNNPNKINLNNLLNILNK